MTENTDWPRDTGDVEPPAPSMAVMIAGDNLERLTEETARLEEEIRREPAETERVEPIRQRLAEIDQMLAYAEQRAQNDEA